jgi:hypothetical protein
MRRKYGRKIKKQEKRDKEKEEERKKGGNIKKI